MSMQDNRAPEDIEGEIEHTRSEMRETLDAIQSKLTPAQMMDEAMTYFRNGPGEFASNLGRIVRNNPVPMALVGVGLAWLAVSSTRRSSESDRDEYGYDEDGYDYASAGAGDYPATVESDYASTGGAYRASWAGSADYGSAGAAYAGGSEAYGTARGDYARGDYARGDYDGDYGGDYGEPSSYYAGSSHEERGRMSHLADSARGRMSKIGDMARHRGQRAREGLTGMAEQQPVMMAAAAFVIGAALGALLPSTRREDEWMGQTRDSLKHQAAAAGREGIERAGRVAEETWTAVGDEALNQGVTRDGGGTSGSSTTGSRSTSSSASSAPSTANKSSAGASASVKSGDSTGTTPSSAAGGTSSGTTPGKKAPDTKPV